jgi:DNA-binding transcriptional LysR family regulator
MDLLDRLALFVRIVDAKSLSGAARSARLSLPAVSRSLRALERELDTTLVVRSTRRLHVTEAGTELHRRALRLLRDVDDTRAAVTGGTEVRGTLVVSASIAYGTTIVAPRLPALLTAHPKLELELRLDDGLASLVGDGVDVAIRAGFAPPDSTAFVAKQLASMRRMVVTSPRWLEKHRAPRTPRELSRHPCLLQVTTRGTVVGWELSNGTKSEIAEPSSRMRSHAPSVLRDLCIRGAGLAYLPDALVADALASGALVRVLESWQGPPIRTWAVYRAELRGTPRLEAFLDVLPRERASSARERKEAPEPRSPKKRSGRPTPR